MWGHFNRQALPPEETQQPRRWIRKLLENDKNRAPSALDTVTSWLDDPEVNIIMVAHSQGVNIAMHILERGLCEDTSLQQPS